jgi:hypothetical protein
MRWIRTTVVQLIVFIRSRVIKYFTAQSIIRRGALMQYIRAPIIFIAKQSMGIDMLVRVRMH